MKKLVILFIICSTPIFGQQNKTITVIGETLQEIIEIEKYNITIEIKEILADGYNNMETMSISKITEKYKIKLNSIGINFNEAIENKVYNSTTSYNFYSYNYKTNIIDDVKKILSVKMQGISSWVTIKAKEKTNTYIAKLNSEAIKDAKNKANLIAKNFNKKIGDILSIEDTNHKEQFYTNNQIPDEKQKYYVKVTFELE